MTIRIAMWSGPRNISTAMMRAWENRPDTVVHDEPFYAHYLKKTGIAHPGAAEVIARQSTDWQEVAHQVSEGTVAAELYFQKHMTLHMLDGMDLVWTKKLRHYFLIRDPLHVVNSYVKKRPEITAEDIGIQRQLLLYEQLCEITGQAIPILDAKDVLSRPRPMMEMLCSMLDIPFYEDMLSWPAGSRDSDGVWAKYWYHAVEASTGFEPFKEPVIEVTEAQRQVAENSRPAYNVLYKNRMSIAPSNSSQA
ncbi:MAG: HAD family hydrolase [SAR324 cluster bacterium]|nr:HAD family hydrolase [SAR324 cluster bacterium]